jgi:hypothetical protein
VFHAHAQHQVAGPLEALPPGAVHDFQLINKLAAQSLHGLSLTHLSEPAVPVLETP